MDHTSKSIQSENDDEKESISVEESSGSQPLIRSDTEQTNTTDISLSQTIPNQPTITINDRINVLKLKYEIREEFIEHFRLLIEYKIIIVCDDSGSMLTLVEDDIHTRWDELREIVKIVLEIGTIFDPSGVDIFFLNRPPIYNVTNPETVNEAFIDPPRGFTPLVPVLENIFKSPITQNNNGKKVLVFIATDGAPTDNKGNIVINELKRIMTEVRNSATTYVTFLLCTDDDPSIGYLNRWDETMTNVDVTDDFKTERDKIQYHQGANYPFSRGDYIVKALVGSIVPEIDTLNEPR